jgi:hypothetical protein
MVLPEVLVVVNSISMVLIERCLGKWHDRAILVAQGLQSSHLQVFGRIVASAASLWGEALFLCFRPDEHQ